MVENGIAETDMAPFVFYNIPFDIDEGKLLNKLKDYGEVRAIRLSGQLQTRHTFTLLKVASVLMNTTNCSIRFSVVNFLELDTTMTGEFNSKQGSSVKNVNTSVSVRNLTNCIDLDDILSIANRHGLIVTVSLEPSHTNKTVSMTVSYENELLARAAVQIINGVVLSGRIISAEMVDSAESEDSHAMDSSVDSCDDKSLTSKDSSSTSTDLTNNLYVKNFSETWDEEKVISVFSIFGVIEEAKVVRSLKGKSKRFGFVNCKDIQSVERCITGLHGKSFEDGNETFILHVSRAENRANQFKDIQSLADCLKSNPFKEYENKTLYIRNIHQCVTDANFRDLCEQYGDIKSCKVMMRNTSTRQGFGYVIYNRIGDAQFALLAIDGMIYMEEKLVAKLHLFGKNKETPADDVEDPSQPSPKVIEVLTRPPLPLRSPVASPSRSLPFPKGPMSPVSVRSLSNNLDRQSVRPRGPKASLRPKPRPLMLPGLE
eukprot:gene2973-5832_t